MGRDMSPAGLWVSMGVVGSWEEEGRKEDEEMYLDRLQTASL